MKRIMPILCFVFLIFPSLIMAREFSKETEYSVLKLDLQGVEKVNENFQVAWIESEPSMPQLKARILPENLEGKVKWTLQINYSRYRITPDSRSFSKELPASESWNIYNEFGSNFYGGTATLTWIYTDNKNNSLPEQKFTFYIRGKNPSEATVKSYIGNSPWFTKAMAVAESGYQNGRSYLEFNEIGRLGPTDAEYKNQPNAASDHGFGIYQLTRFGTSGRVPTSTEIWSWKANVDSAKDWINTCIKEAERHMTKQLELAQILVDAGKMEKIPEIDNKTYGNVTFKDEWYNPNWDKTFTHAVAIKRYNGASKPGGGIGHFVEWDNEKRDWKFYELNNLNFNYVQRICNEYPQ